MGKEIRAFVTVNNSYVRRDENNFFGRVHFSYYIFREIRTPGINGARSLDWAVLPERCVKLRAAVDAAISKGVAEIK